MIKGEDEWAAVSEWWDDVFNVAKMKYVSEFQTKNSAETIHVKMTLFTQYDVSRNSHKAVNRDILIAYLQEITLEINVQIK